MRLPETRQIGLLLLGILAFTLANRRTRAAGPVSPAPFDLAVEAILHRPEFRHASFGIEVISLDTGEPVYSHLGQKLFTPASTTKLLTEGSALAILGPDYQFHTSVYRLGEIGPDGTLHGDLVLVASGDPNLSGRIQPDGTLAFENTDHCYGGSFDTRAVPGDPLKVLREIASQIAAHGITRVDGQVLIDATLFPEGEKELGTGAVISPVIVNDNLVDVTVTPGSSPGAPAQIQVSPNTSYVHFNNLTTTGAASSDPDVEWTDDVAGADGTRQVTAKGNVPAGRPGVLFSYPVPSPSQFAKIAFKQALQDAGIAVHSPATETNPDFKALAPSYTAQNRVAEHVSPPLSEEIKITLKVSQNLHASTMPFILGAVVAHQRANAEQAGFYLERKFLAAAGLDLSGAAQGDGAGGAQSAFFTPDFMARYLTFWSHRKNFDVLYNGLPIMGRDGTLSDIQTQSPAAGHIHAKTGTFDAYDALNRRDMVTGKGLAGYLTAEDGRRFAIALFANRVSVPMTSGSITRIVGQALGEIAAAAYSNPPAPTPPLYDVLIRNGRIVDGTGNPWYAGDIALRGDRIAAIGRLQAVTARQVIDAHGLTVAPGFIDMLGQSESSLLIDNRSLSKLSQGITSEITGEGGSIAPQDPLTLAPLKPYLEHYHLTYDWTTLGGYFRRLRRNRTPINLGTYVGAAQVREAVIGDADRAPTANELDAMKALVAGAMKDGAMGLSTALIYPPGAYARTGELIALARVAASYGGIYATHMRSEGATENEALEEAIRIGHEAQLPVEIFHLKVSGKSRWGSMPRLVARIEAARASGVDVTADMYPYRAGATALASALPPWVADGGVDKLLARLHDPAVRARIRREMTADHPGWENLYFDSGGASGVLISSVMNPALKEYAGMTVARMAQAMHKPPLDALMDFVIADRAQTGALYFMASSKDLMYGLKQPWTSIGLDANETSLDGPLYEPHDHPRAYGSMAKLLGYYVRDHHLMPLEEAIRKITSLPANREHLQGRGLLKPGYYADITIFDPSTIRDTATYLRPASVSQGVAYVFVNGQLEFDHGRLTGVTAGGPLLGPGFEAPKIQVP